MTPTLVLLLGLAHAADAPPPDPTIAAIRAELDRLAAGLTLPDAAPPWLLRAEVWSLDHEARAFAARGALFAHADDPRRELFHEVRVGSPTTDNANFGSDWDDDGLGRVRLVDAFTPDAVRRDVWSAVDAAWRDAWAALARREAARRRQDRDDHPAGYAPGDVVTGFVPDPARPAWDEGALDAWAREASSGYRGQPWVLGNAEVRAWRGRHVVVDTRGTHVSEPLDRAWATWTVSTRAPDGEFQGESHASVAAFVDALPDAAATRERVRRAADRLAAWRALPAEEEPWAGPVIVEGEAAPRLVHDLLLPRLRGTPDREPQDAGDTFATILVSGRVGEPPPPLAPRRRALPEGWSVVDDPTPRDGVGWTWDAEGVPGQVVRLVDDGVVHAHLTSRTPSRWFAASNGHAVQGWTGVARGAPSNVTVTPPSTSSSAGLLRRALKLARQVDLDHVLIVRTIGERDPEAPDDDALVGPPAEVVRHFADGHEEPVRGLVWTGLDARALRDVVAAGPSTTIDLVVGDGPRRVTAPALLVEELELVPREKGDRYEPRVPPPTAP